MPTAAKVGCTPKLIAPAQANATHEPTVLTRLLDNMFSPCLITGLTKRKLSAESQVRLVLYPSNWLI
jgi:hypothetical protein